MKSIAVTSGKGGTGKSCVAAYTGEALAKAGKKTLLLELGASFKALDLITGALDKAVYDIGDVFAGRCEPEQAVVQCPLHPRLYLMPAGLTPPEGATGSGLRSLLKTLEKNYDCIVVDGIDFSIYSTAAFDEILLVLTPDSLCIRACAHHARMLYEQGANAVRLVINNVPARVLPMMGADDFDDIIDQVGVQLIGVIPESPKLQYSSNNAQKVDDESLTVKVFENLAARLQGKRRALLVR